MKATNHLFQVLWPALVSALWLAGCAGGADSAAEQSAATDVAQSSAASAAAPSVVGSADNSQAKASRGSAPGGTTARLVQAVSQTPRKIVYNATVDLVVEKMNGVPQKLLDLVQARRGFVAETEIGGASGETRQGKWKVRVPVEQFNAFMQDVVKLGELQTTHTDSQDITEEYFDVAARLSNKQVEEKRLIEHLQKSTGRLQEILIVEREISRVRGEIEQMQGRLRVMASLSALSTVTITIREVKEYVAPQSTTFGAQVSRTFGGSMVALRDVGRALVLLIVALVPWLVVFGPLAVLFWLWKRRKARVLADTGPKQTRL